VNVDELFKEHRERLLRYLLRLSGNLDVAEDVLQDTFVKALEKPPTKQDNVKAWLFTVATNLLRDRSRRSARQNEILLERTPPAHRPPSPLQHSEAAELRLRLYRALDGLSERERTAIVMRQEGFAHREIAASLGTTTGTVGTLLARALSKLTQRLSLDGDTP